MCAGVQTRIPRLANTRVCFPFIRRRLARIMNTSQMLLWILGTTLFALYFGASFWGEHQRRDELASFADPRRPAAVEWMQAAQAGQQVSAEAPSDQLAVVAPAEREPDRTLIAFGEPHASMFRATAGSLPWFALGGLLTLLAALGLRAGRGR